MRTSWFDESAGFDAIQERASKLGSVHIPLFYPTDEAEIRQMFVILAKKLGSRVAVEDVPAIPQRGHLSGADIEGMVGRALRASILAGADHITKNALATVVAEFMPSTQGLERELQETAAILECTDRQFLPPATKLSIAAWLGGS